MIDLHTHLYGCLPAELLWELAKDLPKDETRLQHFKDEFQKAYGRPPQVDSYWRSSAGLEYLKEDYLFTKPGPFTKFQACINLPIALFPLQPGKNHILEPVMALHHRQGLQYVEYRCFLPPYFSAEEQITYITTLCEQAHLYQLEAAGEFSPRIVLSIPRLNTQANLLFENIKSWQTSAPSHLLPYLLGIDFCFAEEGHPPQEKQEFMARLHRSNRANPQSALSVFYHVGESFEQMSCESSIRWIYQAQQLGVTRLGHALSLGISPQALLGRQCQESAQEYADHLQWLLQHRLELAQHGYPVNEANIRSQLTALAAQMQPRLIHYDGNAVAELAVFQKAVRGMLKVTNATIESCPSSNRLIGQIADKEHHPLTTFAGEGLSVVIGSDDPGIFDSSLCDELTLAAELTHLSVEDWTGRAKRLLQRQPAYPI